jgi:hypothetical protein
MKHKLPVVVKFEVVSEADGLLPPTGGTMEGIVVVPSVTIRFLNFSVTSLP